MRITPRFLVLSIATFVSACAVTDTGNPPAAPDFDPNLVENEATSTGPTTLRGEPGAVFPAEGIVLLTPFGPGASRRVDVAPDGSFSASLDLPDTSEAVRLQVVQGALRSEPLDIDADGEIEPTLPCLRVDKWAQVVFDDTGESTFLVEASNECVDAITFGAPAMRLSPGPLTLVESDIESLAPGAVATLTFRVSRVASGEEILFLPISAPEADTRAITLVVQNP